MLKSLFNVGITSVLFVVVLSQCTKIEYNNPIDIEGTNKDFLTQHPELLLDSDGNNVADLFDLRDTTFPVISILLGDTVEIMKDDPNSQLSIYLDESSISVTDAGGGPISILDPVPQVDIFTVREQPYTITYSAQDSSGNKSTAIRYVKIVNAPTVDKTPPNLSLSQDTIYVTQGGTYVEPVITAFDLKDGDLRSQVVKEGTVDVNVPGVYVIKYSVTDQAGNTATLDGYVKVTEVDIIDHTPPVITLKGDDTLFVAEGQTIQAFIAAYVEPGYTAIDDQDGDITANVIVSEITQLAGSVQYYYITYSVSDAAGNAASPKKRFINTGVTAGIPPAISLTHPDSTFKILIGEAWVEPGYFASDKDDGDITSLVVVDSSNLIENKDSAGTYTITYTVTNSIGLSATVVRYVQVVESEFDTKPPVITLIGRNPDTTLAGGAAYVDPGATAEDNWDGDVTDRITVSGTVNVKTLGKYTLTYRCTDNAGLSSQVVRTVYVVRDTITTDILVRYNVPTEDPLPEMENLKFTTVDIDGDGPVAVKTAITEFTINWSLSQNAFRQFSFQYAAEPYYANLVGSVDQTFAETAPTMSLSGSGVQGLDGDYYVTYDAVTGEFIWVDQQGLFAIIWSP